MARAHNFTAGPAVLPEPVLQELQQAILEYGSTGLGLMEMSHRSKAFDAIILSAEARLRRLMAIPEDYAVLFLQGGASLQFYMHALNLLEPGQAADYLVTGTWGKKALAEAKLAGDAAAAWDGKADTYRHLPGPGDYTVRDAALYLHYTSNNTIYGTEFSALPEAGGKVLVCDMSSDICSRPVNAADYGLIYAGAQKNLGPSGLTVVIASPWALDRSRASAAARGGMPAMLDYALQARERSLYNTPNTWGVYALDRVLAWVEDNGGITAMDAVNQAKADLLYDQINRTGFWRPHARSDCRSRMNVTWRGPSEALEASFLAGAEAAGLKGLKGHRSVGGIRASLYNALPIQSVEALVHYMQAFEASNG